jgi:cytochrome c-type biogenesis protein CcmH
VAIALPAAAFAIYAGLGDFAALSDARSGLSERLRSTPGDVDLSEGAVYVELERHLQRQPGDARALVLKARLDMQAQHFDLAAAAYRFALDGSSKVTRDPAVWLEYAEATALAQGGRLAGPPQKLIDKALSLDPDSPKGLDLAGSAAWERGDFASVVMLWTRLLAQFPSGSARYDELVVAIKQAEQRNRLVLPVQR